MTGSTWKKKGALKEFILTFKLVAHLLCGFLWNGSLERPVRLRVWL